MTESKLTQTRKSFKALLLLYQLGLLGLPWTQWTWPGS